MRKLKRLEDTIPILESDLPKGQGWAYARGFDDLQPVDGVFHVHQVYSAARPGFTGRATVPVLWDRESRTIVNNESSEIIRMLNSEFDEFGNAALDLYPEALRAAIDETNAFVYDTINNGVYRCGFARTQQAYEQSFRKLFAALDRIQPTNSQGEYYLTDVPTILKADGEHIALYQRSGAREGEAQKGRAGRVDAWLREVEVEGHERQVPVARTTAVHEGWTGVVCGRDERGVKLCGQVVGDLDAESCLAARVCLDARDIQLVEGDAQPPDLDELGERERRWFRSGRVR